MYQPHTVICHNKWLYIKREDGADYYKGVPLRIRINPLRYVIGLRWRYRNIATINRGARAHYFVANAVYRIKKALSQSKGGSE